MENALPKTLLEATRYFANDQTCIDFVASLRWADGVAICPHCQSDKTGFLATRKIWKCKNKECRKQFSVKVGTIFEDSAIKLDKWLIAIWMIANCKNGISSYELHRGLGITQKSAWFVLHRIRVAMQVGSIERLSGTIECDETYIGGIAKNMHVSKRIERVKGRGRGANGKAAVMGMLQRKGKVRAYVLKDASGQTLVGHITDNVMPGSEVHTDNYLGYDSVKYNYVHEVINHSIEYVRDNCHTNSIENFWSVLKRAIKGTYISVSPEHLQAYVEEQVFRYNEREGNDQNRFVALIASISGKRLTYAQLIGYQTGH